MRLPSFPLLSRALILVLVTLVAACSRRAPVLEPGEAFGTPPDLRGTRVMVLPVQGGEEVEGDVDAELSFALRNRGPGVDWILPARLQEAMDRSPGLATRLRGLPVSMFAAAEVRRVGDPLYGDLRRLSSLVDAPVALLPVRAWPAAGDEGRHIRMSAALIEVRTGRVLWYGIAEGGAGSPSDPGVLASSAEALARTLLWYVVER